MVLGAPISEKFVLSREGKEKLVLTVKWRFMKKVINF